MAYAAPVKRPRIVNESSVDMSAPAQQRAAHVVAGRDLLPGAAVELEDRAAGGGGLGADLLRDVQPVAGPVLDALHRGDQVGAVELAAEGHRLLDEEPSRGPGVEAEEVGGRTGL